MALSTSIPVTQGSHKVSTLQKNQRTLSKLAEFSGVGLFTGKKVQLKLHPSDPGKGISFQRNDLPGKPILPAVVQYVRGTPRCTVLGKDDVSIQTVEHILAAIRACEIDNVMIELDGPEVPIGDGSAMPFIELIDSAGVTYQKASKKVYHLSTPIFWSQGDVHLVALPSDEFRISYTLNYPNSDILRSQFYTIALSEEAFKTQIAPCRTFSLYEETVPLIEQGLIKGGTLENAVIIKGDAILNPEGLRFPDEMARHKVLDLIGDLSLVGFPFIAHVIAIRSGHFSNVSFAKEILNHFMMENS